MATTYPTAKDDATSLTWAGAATDQTIQADDAVELTEATIALENKLGTGASVASANAILKGNGAGSSEWVAEDQAFSNPVDGYGWIVDPLDHKQKWMSLSAGAGENNTLGTDAVTGVSFIEAKSGTTLKVDNLVSPTGSISLTKNSTDKTIEVELSTTNMPTIPLNKGGTGATTAAGARTALELDNLTNEAQVVLQTGTPGTQQTGNLNLSGTVKGGTVDAGAFKMGATSGVLRLNAGVATTSTTTDNLTEGSGNLYFTNSRVDARITAQKGSASGLATLDGNGKVPSDQLPAIAISDTYIVASEVEQLALTAEKGDIAVRSDEKKSYVHNGGTAGTMADWTLLETPTDSVLSVNGKTGVVSLASTDLSNTADILLKDAVQTVTNKTISGANNTLSVRLGNDVTGQLPVTSGGTGLATIAANSMLYASGADTIAALAPGTDGYFLRSVSGVPTYQAVSIPKVNYDCVVAPTGGDYTTVSAAIAAGCGSIYVKRGTYSEGTSLQGYTLSGKSLVIIGEDQANTILELNASTSGFIELKYNGSILSNFTIRHPNTNLTSNGWIKISASNCILDNLIWDGLTNNSATGSFVYLYGCDNATIQYCRTVDKMPAGSWIDRVGTVTNLHLLYNNIACTYTANSIILVRLTASVNNAVIVGNTFESSHTGGSVLNVNGTYNRIIGNTITSNQSVGSDGCNDIQIAGSGSVVEGNNCIINHSGNQTAISSTATSSSICNNQIIGIYFSAGAAGGISSTGLRTVITGNTIYYNQVGTGTGISVSGDGSVVSGNSITGYSGSGGIGIQTYGTGTVKQLVGDNYIVNCSQRIYDGCAAGTLYVPPINLAPVTANGANTTLDMQSNNGFRISISANTTFAFTDEPSMANKPSQRYELHIVQDATGGRTYAWPANVVWAGGTAPTGSAANKIDRIYLDYSKADQKYYGTYDLSF